MILPSKEKERALRVQYSLGKLLGRQKGRPFLLSEQMAQSHMAILGTTGSGKSRLANLYMRMLARARRGFGVIDPHGDLAEDMLAYVALKKLQGDGSLAQRVHYVEPSY